MSIQSTVNQSISLAGIIFNQSALSEAGKAKQALKKEIKAGKQEQAFKTAKQQRIMESVKSDIEEVPSAAFHPEDVLDINPRIEEVESLAGGQKKIAELEYELKPSDETFEAIGKAEEAEANELQEIEDIKRDISLQRESHPTVLAEKARKEAEQTAARAAQEEATRRAQENLKLEQERLGYTTPSGIKIGPTYGGPREEI